MLTNTSCTYPKATSNLCCFCPALFNSPCERLTANIIFVDCEKTDCRVHCQLIIADVCNRKQTFRSVQSRWLFSLSVYQVTVPPSTTQNRPNPLSESPVRFQLNSLLARLSWKDDVIDRLMTRLTLNYTSNKITTELIETRGYSSGNIRPRRHPK